MYTTMKSHIQSKVFTTSQISNSKKYENCHVCCIRGNFLVCMNYKKVNFLSF
jgi:hypothetical protein